MAETKRRRRKVEEPIIEETVEVKEEVTETVDASVEISEAPILPSKCIVNVPRLNLRYKPDTGSIILNVLNKNDELTILDEIDIFYKVSTSENEIGYVVKEFVEI